MLQVSLTKRAEFLESHLKGHRKLSKNFKKIFRAPVDPVLNRNPMFEKDLLQLVDLISKTC